MIGTCDHAQRVAEQHSLTQAVQHVKNLSEADHKVEVAAKEPCQKVDLRVLDDFQMTILMGFAPFTQCHRHYLARKTWQASNPYRLVMAIARVKEVALG